MSKKLTQQIAVFGESGSGKTVLLSSFYGATQELDYLQNNPFNVVADNVGQGNRLHQNYLGMRNSARLPEPDRFAGTSYSFSIKLRHTPTKTTKNSPFDALGLVWHDYPGEWFEQDVSGPEEAKRRLDTFRSLLGSDVALLLVDGQKLLAHESQEERYLKSLLGNFRNTLLNLKDDLLTDGKKLVSFPRIWVLALSKADLLPTMNVHQFRELMIDKAAGEIEELRGVLAEIVEGAEALSVGEDYLLVSSAKFTPDKIVIENRVGVETILPLAAMLPFERHVHWYERMKLPANVAQTLVAGTSLIASVIVGKKIKVRPSAGKLAKTAVVAVGNATLLAVAEAVKLTGGKLQEFHTRAQEDGDALRAVLTGFKLALETSEEKLILMRSKR
ncbi:MAG: hypothetical protein FWG08_05190 [Propionibacteriaceae bacterium]|nr:hypothetical protein [Propionibacteriaceae bacterium]